MSDDNPRNGIAIEESGGPKNASIGVRQQPRQPHIAQALAHPDALSPLTLQQLRSWADRRLDHYEFLGFPRYAPGSVVPSLDEVKRRIQLRRKEIDTFQKTNDAAYQDAASSVLDSLLLEDLAAWFAAEKNRNEYHATLGLGELERVVHAYVVDDGRIDYGEYRKLRTLAARWSLTDADLESVIERVDQTLREAGKRSIEVVERERRWEPPLRGAFRDYQPSTIEELHQAMIAEPGPAHDILIKEHLEFYLRQHEEAALMQEAAAARKRYAEQGTLAVWAFAWKTGYRALHPAGRPAVSTVDEIVRVCDGDPQPIVGVLKSGELALWCEIVAEDAELSEKALLGNEPPEERAVRWLWAAGERRLKLASAVTVDSPSGLRAVMVQSPDTTQAAVATLWNGTLEAWLSGRGQARGDLAAEIRNLGRERGQITTAAAPPVSATRRRVYRGWTEKGFFLRDESGKIIDSSKVTVTDDSNRPLDPAAAPLSTALFTHASTPRTSRNDRNESASARDLVATYSLLWLLDDYRALPIRVRDRLVELERPAEVAICGPEVAQALLPLLHSGLLARWSAMHHDAPLAERWIAVGRDVSKEVQPQAMRWAAGATELLWSGGTINTLPELFVLFESQPGAVRQLWDLGALVKWVEVRNFTIQGLSLADARKAKHPLDLLAFLWSLGYLPLSIDTHRVTTLQELAALPDSAQPALQQAIDRGAVAAWWTARKLQNQGFPEFSPPDSAESLLRAAGAPAPALEISPRSIDFGAVAEDGSASMTVVVRARGTGGYKRGYLKPTVSCSHAQISVAPESLGQLWAAKGDKTTVRVQLRVEGPARHTATLRVMADGITAREVPISWQPRFPIGRVSLIGGLGLACGGVGMSMLRGLLGQLAGGSVYIQEASGAWVTRDLDWSFWAALSLGWLPALIVCAALVPVLRPIVARFKGPEVKREDVTNRTEFFVAIAYFPVALLLGWAVPVVIAGLDTVGYRLTWLVNQAGPLSPPWVVSAGFVGWAVTGSLFGLGLGLAIALARYRRDWQSWVALVGPAIVLATLLTV